MKHKYILLGFGISTLCCISQIEAQPQNPLIHAMHPRNTTPGGLSYSQAMKGAVEIPSMRTLHSSSYKLPDGTIFCTSSLGLMNYPDATGKLQPVSSELHSDSKGWAADQQPNPCYFRSDRSTAISLGVGADELDFNINSSINGSAYEENISSLDKNVVSLDLATGIHKKITFGNNSIETDYILDNSIGSEVTVSEEVKFPFGYSLVRDKKLGRETKDGWKGDYVLVSEKDNSEAARFNAPVIYDSKGEWCIGSYSTKVKDGKTILLTTVPSNWLSTAVYPIVIDPLITGPTSKWIGGDIESCLFPNFMTDSILVTIPANITITQFMINFMYQSVFPTTMDDGKVYFSTPCRNNPHDTISCDQDIYGYCYLDTGAVNNFSCSLTGCYPPSINTQSFYLVVHLSRMTGGTICDSDYIFYSQIILEPWYQFMGTVFGHTVETGSNPANDLIVTPPTQCSDVCTLQMSVKVQNGVPPYKISHPWCSTQYSTGAYSFGSCTSTGSQAMTLTIPGCPTYCANNDTLTVPPPLVIDAAGDTVTGWPVKKVVLKATPKITTTPALDSVCGNGPLKFTATACLPGTTITWTGSDGSSGSGNILTTPTNPSNTNPFPVTYIVSGSLNGCSAFKTDTVTGVITPYPIITITGNDTIKVINSTPGTPDNLTASGGTSYTWTPSAGLSCTNCPNPVATPTATTVYTLEVKNQEGCSSVDSVKIVVTDLNTLIVIPNVITPNVEGINGYFAINGLQYYPNSSLSIFDRWGKEVYTTSNYSNNWNGGDQSAGVYYYFLTLNNGKKYNGLLQIIK